jgi:hypothetical protein
MKKGDTMARSYDELTIDELLSDPVTHAVMKADGVDPSALAAMLRAMAGTMEQGFDRPNGSAVAGDGARSPCVSARTRNQSRLGGAR